MSKNKLIHPFLKWAGGKRQLITTIRQHMPHKYNSYYEPFLGAGAVLFDLQPKEAIINDSNFELINCYMIIKDSLESLLHDLKKHKNEKEYYYSIRDLDRKESFQNMSLVEKASRIIYLNKTCYNGLFRVNSAGHFNVPFGNYHNPAILNEIVLRAVSKYLISNEITILNGDFVDAVKNAKKGDFIYFDPPYDPISDTSSFTGYDLNGFGQDDQVRLKEVYQELDKKGCYVLLSNSATKFILDLYKEYEPISVTANRNINSVASGRGKIDEVLIKNYA